MKVFLAFSKWNPLAREPIETHLTAASKYQHDACLSSSDNSLSRCPLTPLSLRTADPTPLLAVGVNPSINSSYSTQNCAQPAIPQPKKAVLVLFVVRAWVSNAPAPTFTDRSLAQRNKYPKNKAKPVFYSQLAASHSSNKNFTPFNVASSHAAILGCDRGKDCR